MAKADSNSITAEALIAQHRAAFDAWNAAITYADSIKGPAYPKVFIGNFIKACGEREPIYACSLEEVDDRFAVHIRVSRNWSSNAAEKYEAQRDVARRELETKIAEYERASAACGKAAADQAQQETATTFEAATDALLGHVPANLLEASIVADHLIAFVKMGIFDSKRLLRFLRALARVPAEGDALRRAA